MEWQELTDRFYPLCMEIAIDAGRVGIYEPADLAQEAAMRLPAMAESFDESRGVSFEKYMAGRIRFFIGCHVRNISRRDEAITFNSDPATAGDHEEIVDGLNDEFDTVREDWKEGIKYGKDTDEAE